MRKSLKKTMAILLALLLVLCSSIAMAEGGEGTAAPEASAEQAQWTVLLYLCGTDLETYGSMASYNLAEIAKTTANASVNFVVQTGGTKTWHAKESVGLDIATDKLQRYTYSADGYQLVDEQPLANMAYAGTLTDFVKWGAQNYPAEKTMLILWDHGGGSSTGLIADELHNRAIMTLEQLEIALDSAAVPLEALVLDTCLMASLETAQAVKNSVKYLIASEESVPGQGSAYQKWLQYLYNNPACDGARFGKVLCDASQQKYAELGSTTSARQLTFSVIDLSKIDAVSAAFDNMFVEVGALLENPENFAAFGYFTQHMQHYESNAMVDLADMASRAQNLAITNDTANAVIEAVDAAVVYNLKGDLRSYSHGISFYYSPSQNPMSLDHYARSCKSAPYLAFLDAANMDWTAPAWVYEKTARLKEITREGYIIETAVNLDSEGLPMLTVTNAKGSIAAVDAHVYQRVKDTDEWTYLGVTDQVDGSFDTGIFTMSFPANWMTLDGEFCQVNVIEEMDTHTLYGIPFQLMLNSGDVRDYQFRYAYIYNTPLTESEAAAAQGEEVDPYAGHIEFYGVWDYDSANTTALPSRSAIELSSFLGYQIHLQRRSVTLPDMVSAGYANSKDFTLTAELKVGEQPLPKGEYAIAFSVTDGFGDKHTSHLVYANWDGENAVFSGAEPIADESEAEPAA